MSLSGIFKRSPIEAGNLARDAGDWAGAVKAYADALKATPANAPIWVQYGHALKEVGRLSDAEAAYRTALEHEPHNSDTHLQIGHLLKIQGKPPQALAAYVRAAELDPTNADAQREKAALVALLGSDAATPAPARAAAKVVEVGPRTVFDCSDLIQYFRDNRLPTGIQRVQMNIVSQYIGLGDEGGAVAIVFFDLETRSWRRIRSMDFQRLINTAQNVDGVTDLAWRAVFSQICGPAAERYVFGKGDVLVNLGTSWWIPDYFLLIRSLKHASGIRYVPFLHDCIPLVTPEYCSVGLVEEFREWLGAVFRHSDAYLVNSQATANDVVRFARQYGYEIPTPKIVRLDGDTRSGGAFEAAGFEPVDLSELFLRERMPPDAPFVLMVSTLEARKNHILALRLWDRMIREKGEAATPYLLCVGKSGWRFEEAQDFMAVRKHLGRRVRFVSNLSDDVLGQLYRNCIFTLYPSHYEGWGLPVTESLCYGKAAVVSRNSSLTEAGREFADYFQPGALDEAYAAVTRLLTDADYRKGREDTIRKTFKPRSWSDVARDVSAGVSALRAAEGTAEASHLGVQVAPTGVVLSFVSATAVPAGDRHRPGADLRIGAGWHRCEDWGVWTNGPEARFAFTSPGKAMENCGLYLGVRTPNQSPLSLTIICPAVGYEGTFDLDGGRDRDLLAQLGAVPADTPIEILLLSDNVIDLAEVTGGADSRKIGVGVRWLGLADWSDVIARLNFIEAARLQEARTKL